MGTADHGFERTTNHGLEHAHNRSVPLSASPHDDLLHFHVEGHNTSTVVLHVARGDEKGTQQLGV
jgi:hypothetical protein